MSVTVPGSPDAASADIPEVNISAGIANADELQGIMEHQQTLTTEHEMWVQEQVGKWAAMRESNRIQLKIITDWPEDREYIVDPLANKISEAFADLLFGEDPTITAAQTAQKRALEAVRRARAKQAEVAAESQQIEQTGQVPPPLPNVPATPPADIEADQEADITQDETAPTPPSEVKQGGGDQELLDNIIEANNLSSELRHAEELASSEGEVWWRIYTDHGQSDYPIIEWYSRSHVRPLFRGRKLVAAGFVSEIYREELASQWIVYRYIEIQAEGHVRNLLYRGTLVGLGVRIPLTSRPETELLEDEWNHGLGMLAGRVPNKLGRDRRYGISDYESVADLLLSLNEATTIGHENARLVAKRRIAIPREALADDGTFDAGEDIILIDEPLDDQMGQNTAGGKFQVLEYQFDAEALIAYKTDIAGIILTRVGIAQQFVNASGRSQSSEGMAASGTALRLRLIPTTLAAKGKARYWDDALPKILLLAQLIDKLPEQQGGFGRNWSLAGEVPVVERTEPLPEDEMEEINRHAVAVSSEIESRRTAIAELHPDWDDDQIQQELDQIQSELSTFGSPKPTGAGVG